MLREMPFQKVNAAGAESRESLNLLNWATDRSA